MRNLQSKGEKSSRTSAPPILVFSSFSPGSLVIGYPYPSSDTPGVPSAVPSRIAMRDQTAWSRAHRHPRLNSRECHHDRASRSRALQSVADGDQEWQRTMGVVIRPLRCGLKMGDQRARDGVRRWGTLRTASCRGSRERCLCAGV